jgi:lysophospholipid acyltransferase (LPLAT)-like uncharacterized protein
VVHCALVQLKRAACAAKNGSGMKQNKMTSSSFLAHILSFKKGAGIAVLQHTKKGAGIAVLLHTKTGAGIAVLLHTKTGAGIAVLLHTKKRCWYCSTTAYTKNLTEQFL